MIRRLALLLAVALLAACTSGAVQTTTTTQAVQEPTTTTVEVTTTAVVETTTTTEAGPVVLGEFTTGLGLGNFRRLAAGTTYSMAFDGFTLELTPPMEHWILLGFTQSRASFGWDGPSGFRDGALEVVIYDVDVDGAEAAWAQIEGLRDRFSRDIEWDWVWVDTGTGFLGDREAEWREVRFPPVPADDPAPDNPTLMPLMDTPYPTWLAHDSSARFYAVPVGDLTVTVLVWESRCKCAEGLFGREDHIDRDVENELSMWIDELEAFLAAMELVES